MRIFYDKIMAAEMSETPAETLGNLMEAYVLGMRHLDRARARCEFRTVDDIERALRWTAYRCSEKHAGGDLPPWDLWPFGSSFGCFADYVPKRCGSSLDWRWRRQAEEAESWLPGVPCWTRGPQLDA